MTIPQMELADTQSAYCHGLVMGFSLCLFFFLVFFASFASSRATAKYYPPLPTPPHPNMQLNVEVDAFDSRVGAVLSQVPRR